MKNFLFSLFILLLVCSCYTQQKAASSARGISIVNDSTEYEITIIDPGFDQWYTLNFSPSKDYSNEYYRGKNLNTVSNWNIYLTHGKYPLVIDSFINYDPSVDYGIEVNRRLFWYFKYSEQKYYMRIF